MRVAFAGSSGTGKTTLARHVAEKYGVEMCPVGSRSVAREMGFANPYDVDAAGLRHEFQRRVFEAKRQWEAERESFVTDRTCMDNLAYLICDGDPKQFATNEVDAYVTAFARYDVVFFTPIQSFQNIGGDPARVVNPAYHRVYEMVLHGLLTRSRAQKQVIAEVWPLSVEGRTDFVDGVIERANWR